PHVRARRPRGRDRARRPDRGARVKAIEVREHGAAEVLRLAEVADPELQVDEVLIDVHAAGVNRVDILMRSGAFHGTVALPFVPGREVSGVVAATGGAAASQFATGERVLAYGVKPGAYSER